MADGSRTEGSRTEPIRVAHVGCGAWGANLVRELEAHPDVELVMVIDPEPRALSVARRLSPGVAISRSTDDLERTQVDAVVIASPGPLHAEHATAALRMGAHVFLEKPMTTDVAQARALLSRCQASHRIGMVGHLLHHHGAVRAMLALVGEGRIGSPRSFRSARLCSQGSRDADGSLLWSLAPHDMSVLRALDPRPVRQMGVELRTLGRAITPNVADVRLRLAGGLEAHVVVSRAHRTKVRRMEIVGDDATVVFDDLSTDGKLTLRWHGGMERIEHDEVPPLRVEVNAFVRCVKTATMPEIGFLQGVEVVELLERAHAVASRTSDSPVLSDVASAMR